MAPSTRRDIRLYAAAILACSLPTLALANLQQGDVLQATPHAQNVGGPMPGDIFLMRQGQSYQSIIHFPSIGTLGVGLDAARRIYVTRNVDVAVYDQTGTFLRSMAPGVTFTSPGRVVFDTSGSIYVTGGYQLVKLDSSGNLLATLNLTGATGIDLAQDQCTMYFTLGQTLGRYDVCRDLRLADVTSALPASGLDLRILPDGSLLVAIGASAVRVSAAGTLLQTYPVIAYAVALAPDGKTFFAGPGVSQVDVQSGTQLSTLLAPSPATALAVVGEPRAALTPSGIPTLSQLLLLLLAAALCTAGFFGIYRA